MTSLADRRFLPNPAARRVYDELYGIYRELHDTFGGMPAARADFPSLMKRLLAIRERAAGETPAGASEPAATGAVAPGEARR
jgi:L-ribulokinase